MGTTNESQPYQSEPEYGWPYESELPQGIKVSDIPQVAVSAVEGIGLIGIAAATLAARGIQKFVGSVRQAKK